MSRSTIRRLALLAPLVSGCGDPGSEPRPVTTLALALEGLSPLDATVHGHYAGWVIDDAGVIHPAGAFTATAGSTRVTLTTSAATVQHVVVTVEPPHRPSSPTPSLHTILGGTVVDGNATLNVTGYVTVVGEPLEPAPGTFVLASPSNDDVDGFPSAEDAGLWLHDPARDTTDAAYYDDFAPLTEGWAYEGWVVRDHDTPDAVWISYGKFRPGPFRQARYRDDTGLGPYSGRLDYVFALGLTLHVPGDDWLDNPYDLPVPGGLPLPLDLNGDATTGQSSRWTHVITLEPWEANREPRLPPDARPFGFGVYVNAIGDAPPATPRSIRLRAHTLPTGTATVVR